MVFDGLLVRSLHIRACTDFFGVCMHDNVYVCKCVCELLNLKYCTDLPCL